MLFTVSPPFVAARRCKSATALTRFTCTLRCELHVLKSYPGADGWGVGYKCTGSLAVAPVASANGCFTNAVLEVDKLSRQHYRSTRLSFLGSCVPLWWQSDGKTPLSGTVGWTGLSSIGSGIGRLLLQSAGIWSDFEWFQCLLIIIQQI